MKFPCLYLLAYDGKPDADVTEYIQQLMLSKPTGWSSVRYRRRSGNSMLPHVRNTAVSDFLDEFGDCTDLILIDCDNYPDLGGIEKLLTYDVDVVGVPIRAKDEPIKWNVRWKPGIPIRRELNGLIEVETVGTGLLRLSRKCLETMRAAVKNDWYYDRFVVSGKSWPIFGYRIVDHEWLGEDVGLCMDWGKLGGRVYVDPDINSHHIGRKTYSGCLTKWLQESPQALSLITNPEVKTNELSKDFNVGLPLHSEQGAPGPAQSVLDADTFRLNPFDYTNGGGPR